MNFVMEWIFPAMLMAVCLAITCLVFMPITLVFVELAGAFNSAYERGAKK